MESLSRQEVNRLWIEHLEALHSSQRGLAEAWLNLDLTMPQLKVLFIISAEESVTVSGLASRLGVAPPTVTGIIDRLVQRDMVERHDDLHDRRIVQNILTPEGQERVMQLQRAQAERFGQILEQMTDSEVETLRKALKAVLRASQDLLESSATSESGQE